MTLPAASLITNFAGIVWPSLNLLSSRPVCAVSLIGCRNPSQRKFTVYVTDLPAVLPALSAAPPHVAVKVPTPFDPPVIWRVAGVCTPDGALPWSAVVQPAAGTAP